MAMQAVIEIRRAVEEDAPALSALAEETFRTAFANSNTAANMHLHCVSSYGRVQQLAEIRDAGRETWVAESDGKLVAFVQLRLDAVSPMVTGERPVEIQRFYVNSAYHGRGLAHQLMARILERVDAAGASVLWLGVWERNPRAVAFYRKCGFEVVGSQTFKLGNDPQRDMVMRRNVTSVR